MLLVLALTGCERSNRAAEDGGMVTVVFKHGSIAGDHALVRQLLDRFEQENPGIRIKDETLPASTDEQHQYYVINLEGKSRGFDVLSMDAIWVPEFSRARNVAELLMAVRHTSWDRESGASSFPIRCGGSNGS